jgi:hypothetical protein
MHNILDKNLRTDIEESKNTKTIDEFFKKSLNFIKCIKMTKTKNEYFL